MQRQERRRVKVRALLTALLATALAVPMAVTPAAPAAAASTFTVGIVSRDPSSGVSPQPVARTLTLDAATDLGYTISYACSGDEACRNAKVHISPSQLDPTYGVFPLLFGLKSWTAPFPGATITGTPAAGWTVSLGDLTPGAESASGSFFVVFQWRTRGAVAIRATEGSFFPDGFPIEMSVTPESAGMTGAAVDADPVPWRVAIQPGYPTVSASVATVDSDTDIVQRIGVNTGCASYYETTWKGDARNLCAKGWSLVYELPEEAQFVASAGWAYDAPSHTATYTVGTDSNRNSRSAIGTMISGTVPITLHYPRSAFGGECNFIETVSGSLHAEVDYIGLDPATRVVNTPVSTVSHVVSCQEPFAAGTSSAKTSTFDGTTRLSSSTVSPVVVQPAPALNEHYWRVQSANRSNVAASVVFVEEDLSIEGTRVYRIEARNASDTAIAPTGTISATLSDGEVVTGSGSIEVTDGRWFVSAEVTSEVLPGPNLTPAQTGSSPTFARFYYRVTADAPVGERRTNTVESYLTFPGGELPDFALPDRSHSLEFVAPFGRSAGAKSSTNNGTDGDVQIVQVPLEGTSAYYWDITVYNTGNVPGNAVISDDFTGAPFEVFRLEPRTINATATIVLDNGTVITGQGLPYSAPTGRSIVSFTSTSAVVEPVVAYTTQNSTSAAAGVRAHYRIAAGEEIGLEWTNVADTSMTYPGMGVADAEPAADPSRTIRLSGEKPRIETVFVGSPVVEGGGSAVPGRDVTYTVRATSQNIEGGIGAIPQYVFLAPAAWSIAGARFVDPAWETGATYETRTVTVGGQTRQAVVVTWQSGFGPDLDGTTTWPDLAVRAQPTFAAAVNSAATATVWAGISNLVWTDADATFVTPQTDTPDVDGDGETAERFASRNSAAVTVGLASQLQAVKEICRTDPTAADGCDWIAQPDILVGVSPTATGIAYRLRLVNTGNSSLSNVVAYDVLPHPGDTGVSAGQASVPRGSDFAEQLSTVGPVSSNVTLSYSESTNPCRAEVYPGGPTGCVNDWSGTAAGAVALKVTVNGSLAPGQEASIVYAADIVGTSDADSKACNSIAVVAAEIPGVVNEPPAVCATAQLADLSLDTADRFPLQQSRPGVVPFTVTNHGDSSAAAATVTLSIPAGLSVLDLTPEGWSCVASATGPGGVVNGPVELECKSVNSSGDSRSLALETPELLELSVLPTVASGELCVEGVVSGPLFDDVSDNNEASSCATVVAADAALDVAKSDGLDAVAIGDEVTYTIDVANLLVGESVADASVTDTLPAGTVYVASSSSGTHADAEPDGSGGTVTWTIDALAPAGVAGDGTDAEGGADAQAQLTVTVRITGEVGDEVANVVSVDAPDPAVPSGTTLLCGAAEPCVDTDVDAVRRVELSKVSDAPAGGVRAGDDVTYTITVTNPGTGDYTEEFPLTIVDDLSGLLDDAAYVAGSGTVSIDDGEPAELDDPVSALLTWQGALAAGSIAVFSYTVTISDDLAGDEAVRNAVFANEAGTCEDGVDDADYSCAVTVDYFAPTLEKSVAATVQQDDGSWSIVYEIVVTNPNADEARSYDLGDTLRFGDGMAVASAAVTDAPDGVTTDWDGSGEIVSGATIAGGAAHRYEVTVTTTAAANSASAAARQCVTGSAGGFANQAALGGDGLTALTAEACAELPLPTVSKEVTGGPTQQADGSWVTEYTIDVENDSAVDLTYTLEDALTIPADVTVVSVDADGPSGADLNPDFDGTTDTDLLAGADTVPAESSRSFTVTLTTDVVPGALDAAELRCAEAGASGYANAVTLLAGTSTVVTGQADACADIEVAPTPTITKEVSAASIDPDGNWVVEYTITVTNPSSTLATEYSLSDQLQPGADVVLDGTSSVVSNDGVSVDADWDGATATEVAEDVPLSAGAVHTYTVSITADATAVPDDAAGDAAGDCLLDTGESGTGLRNVATLAVGVVSPSPSAVACQPVANPSLVKTVASAPTQQADGSWVVEYQLVVENRATIAVPYTLRDELQVPDDGWIVDVDVTAPEATEDEVVAGFDGIDETDIIETPVSLAPALDEVTPTRHVYTVTVTFVVPPGTDDALLACDPEGGTGGLLNTAAIGIGGGRERSDAACVDAPFVPVPTVEKSVTSQEQRADGSWALEYEIVVTNPSDTVITEYGLDDAFALGDGIALVGPPEAAGDSVAPASDWNGTTEATFVERELLPAGGSHVYTVTAVLDSGSVTGSDAAGDCVLDDGETATGFGNRATLKAGAQSRTASACAAVHDPAVVKEADGEPVRQADGSWQLAYVITVTNPSDDVALRYSLEDRFAFPDDTVVNDLTVLPGAGQPGVAADWDGAGQPVLVPPGSALPGGAVHQYRIEVNATLPGSVDADAVWANTATVASGTDGRIRSEDGAEHEIELPSLEIEKSVDATAPLKVGDQVSYEVTLRNTGEGDFTTLYPAALWDDLAGVLDDASFDGDVSVTGSNVAASFGAGRVRWSGAIRAGATVTLRYAVTIDEIAGDAELTNVAFGAAPGEIAPATPAAEDCADALDCATTTTLLPALAISKTVDADHVVGGGTVVYTVTVTNTGRTDIPAGGPARFSDDLNSVLASGSYRDDATADRGAVRVSGGVLSWSGALAVGESATITYSVDVDATAPVGTVLRNVAALDGSYALRSADDDAPSDIASAETEVVAALPVTGSSGIAMTALLALALLLLGAGVLVVRRRRVVVAT